jgi:hypothetical protein
MSKAEELKSGNPPEQQATMSDAPPDAADGDALGSALGEREQFPLHEESVATLTMKCGSPQLAVRKKLHDEIAVPFVPEEGFAVFQTKVERHFAKLGPIYVQEKRAIYMKPSSNATQSKYILLTKDNFEAVLRMRWKIAKSMKTELKYEVFCYFVDTTSKKDKRRRLLQQQVQQIKQFQPGDPNFNHHGTGLLVDAQAAALSGAISDQAHSFLSFAALPNGMQGYGDVAASFVDSSGTKRTRQLDDVGVNDRLRRAPRGSRAASSSYSVPAVVPSDGLDESLFVPIPFRINGVDVPIEMDIAALRRSLALLPPMRPAQALPTSPLPTEAAPEPHAGAPATRQSAGRQL